MFRPSLLMMLARSGVGRLILRLMLDRRVPIWSKLIIPGGLVYILSPIDFIPDIIPILGWLDDSCGRHHTPAVPAFHTERCTARPSGQRQNALARTERQRNRRHSTRRR